MQLISIVVAASENNVIGLKGGMPWKKLPADLKFFKDKTMGRWCILGRKTYNALGNQLLTGRKFIVVTRDKDFVSEDSVVVHSLNAAFVHPALAGEDEICVLGGGDIYKQSMPFVNRIHLTRIHETFEGDTFFTVPDNGGWVLRSEEFHKKDDKNPYDYSFLVYDKK